MTFVETILHQMPELSKPRRSFLLALFTAFSCFVGRATMLNLSRFGAGSPRRISRWFNTPMDWHTLNWAALRHAEVTSHTLVACIDCTFIPKSGSKTWGLASFHNGVSGRSETGCEAIVLGILDPLEHTAYSLVAWQTPASFPEQNDDRKNEDDEYTRVDFYAQCVLSRVDELERNGITHLVADGGFARTKILDALEGTGVHLISKVRQDAHMRYLYKGPRKKGRGRPKCYDGKVDWSDLSRFEKVACEEDGVDFFWADLNSPHFKRDLRVVVVVRRVRGKQVRNLLFSTDMELDPCRLYQLYKLRFQQEFVFRDGKQFTGLADGQMRDEKKRHEHLNASLSALNLMRLEERDRDGKGEKRVISMASWKRRRLAEYVAHRIFEDLDLDANTRQNHPVYQKLRQGDFLAA